MTCFGGSGEHIHINLNRTENATEVSGFCFNVNPKPHVEKRMHSFATEKGKMKVFHIDDSFHSNTFLTFLLSEQTCLVSALINTKTRQSVQLSFEST